MVYLMWRWRSWTLWSNRCGLIGKLQLTLYVQVVKPFPHTACSARAGRFFFNLGKTSHHWNSRQLGGSCVTHIDRTSYVISGLLELTLTKITVAGLKWLRWSQKVLHPTLLESWLWSLDLGLFWVRVRSLFERMFAGSIKCFDGRPSNFPDLSCFILNLIILLSELKVRSEDVLGTYWPTGLSFVRNLNLWNVFQTLSNFWCKRFIVDWNELIWLSGVSLTNRFKHAPSSW